MVFWPWLLIAFWVGGMVGVLGMALLTAGKDTRDVPK